MRLSPARAVLLIILAATILRIVLAAITDLGLDEAYAVAVGHRFQLSWFDHPPLTFWITGAMLQLFGLDAAPVVLRLPFIALSAATTWLLFRLASRHFGDRAGLWAAALFTAAPFFLLSAGSWLVPDGPLCFALVVCALALTSIVLDDTRSAHWRDWLLAGAALGLALLSKYHAALFAFGAVAFFALHPKLRFWFARPQPYVAVLVAVLVFSPVLIWNAQNEWASFAFQLGRGAATSTEPLIVLRLFLFEAAYLLPTTAALLVAALVWAATRRSVSVGFFLALALPIILITDATRFWTWQSYAHWSMPGWMLLLPVLGAMLVAWRERWRFSTPLVTVLTAAELVLVVAGVVLLFSSLRIPEPGAQSYRTEAGRWTGVAAGIRETNALASDPLLVTNYWRDAARLAEALRIDAPVFVFSNDPRGFAWSDAGDLIGRDALIVSEADVPTVFADYFERFEPIGKFAIEPGASHALNIVRGVNLLKLYPLPYGPHAGN